MIRLAGWTLALALLAACASGKKAQPGMYDEACTAVVGCVTGLSCLNGMCTRMCTSNMECMSLGPRSICANNTVCYDACQDQSNCPNGLSCVMNLSPQGTCRPLGVSGQ